MERVEVKHLKLVTCGLPYTNGKAHIGHLRTYIPADIYVRYLRMMGEDVVFVCGSDCHGTPIVINAENEGVTPRDLVNKYHDHFQKVFKSLDVEFDYYGKTDSQPHHQRTQELVQRIIDNGYIYTQEIELAYCPVCQRFLPDRYVEGTCPYCGEIARGDECDQGCGRYLEPGEILGPTCKVCGSGAVYRKQRHYFFQLSRFKGFLQEYLKNVRGTENALNYAREWIKGELRDWCITRNLDWGVKFPGEDLVVYVWVDAPIGYITFTEKACEKLGKDWKNIWFNNGEIIHFIGLDIVYHHCIFWPAMLKGSGYSLPHGVVASGMIKVEGKKLSKSRGHVVWVEEDYLNSGFTTDFLRYYLVNYTSHQKDLNFSWELFKEKINNELIATLGNFLYRVMFFAWKNFGEIEVDEDKVDSQVTEKIKETEKKLTNAVKEWELKIATDSFMELATFGNNYFQNNRPWELIKTDRKACEEIMASCLQIARALLIFSYPVAPRNIYKMGEQMGLDLENVQLKDALQLAGKVSLQKPQVPFEKIDDETIESMEKNMLERIKKAEGGEIEMGMEEAPEIDIEDLKKMDLRIGKIVKAENVKKSKKLMRLEVDIGNEVRQMVAGIAADYSPEELEGKLVPVLVNMKPAKLMGVESKGMILAADVNGKPILMHPDKDVPPGANIR
ncbi:MAG: methionine--tRNA ligase [Archaeoglobaceae archaeon]